MSSELGQQGWTRRFTALGKRLSEAVELYRQLGFEIRLEPVNPDEDELANSESCRHCVVATLARTIYTRPSDGSHHQTV
jgi:hypothetical protein